MTKPDPLVVDLNTKMFANRIRPGDACKKAVPPIAPSTWSRWASGGAPDIATLRRLEAVVDEMIVTNGS